MNASPTKACFYILQQTLKIKNMKNALKKIGLYSSLAAITFSSTGCMGSWALTTGLYNWNNSVSDKYINNAIFWILNIIPVYSGAIFIDAVILNFIEFWSGSNPIAMNEGEVETQYLVQNGEKIEMIATKNQFEIKNLNTGKSEKLVFTTENQTWNLEKEGELIALVQIIDNGTKVKLYNGSNAVILDNTNLAFNEMMNSANLAMVD